jgi:hypothetical protein
MKLLDGVRSAVGANTGIVGILVAIEAPGSSGAVRTGRDPGCRRLIGADDSPVQAWAGPEPRDADGVAAGASAATSPDRAAASCTPAAIGILLGARGARLSGLSGSTRTAAPG